MIDPLPADQIHLLADLARQAHADEHIENLDPDALCYHWTRIYEMGIGQIFARVGEHGLDGAIGVVVEADLYTGETQALEAFFYVLPEHRSSLLAQALLTTYDQWAAEKGAVRQFITAHWGEDRGRLERMYRRRGYEARAVQYAKMVRNELQRQQDVGATAGDQPSAEVRGEAAPAG